MKSFKNHRKIFRSFRDKLEHLQLHKNYPSPPVTPGLFLTAYKNIQKLQRPTGASKTSDKLFKTSSHSRTILNHRKIFRTLRKFHQLCKFIPNYSCACRIFFTSCGQSEKIFRTLRKFQKLCSFIQNYCEACRIFYKLWAVRKNIQDTQEVPQAL